MSSQPVPKELQRAGIKRVTDNREGREVRLPPGALFDFFGEELRARFLTTDEDVGHGRAAKPDRF